MTREAIIDFKPYSVVVYTADMTNLAFTDTFHLR